MCLIVKDDKLLNQIKPNKPHDYFCLNKSNIYTTDNWVKLIYLIQNMVQKKNKEE